MFNQEYLISKNIYQCNKKNTADNRRFHYHYDYGMQFFGIMAWYRLASNRHKDIAKWTL